MGQIEQLQAAIVDLYSSVERLHDAFPEKPFTPDGRMVGDIGEAIASLRYGVVIDKKLRRHWDGYRIDTDGNKREVQIKATQSNVTYLKEPPHDGDLIIFQILKSGEWKCHYDGDIMTVWDYLKNLKKNKAGEKMFNLKALEDLVQVGTTTKAGKQETLVQK